MIDKLRERYEAGIGGLSTQLLMAPKFRMELLSDDISYTPAAVLCLFYPEHDGWHMVFMERVAHEKDVHSGQISFPGGKVESSDDNYMETAIREAHEEIGVDPAMVKVIGPMTPLKIPVSKFEVFPYLAYTETTPDFIAEEGEVARIIKVPFDQLIDNSRVQEEMLTLSSGFRMQVPVYKFDDCTIWGATAMMLSEVIEMLTEE